MPETTVGKPLKLLIAGLRWPPETFLERLIDGLIKAGVQVTVATANPPGIEWTQQTGFTWLPVPAWEGSYPRRLMRLVWQLIRARITSPRDMRILGKHVQQARGLNDRLRLWQRWTPYAGKRWDVIYFPWNSGAIEHLALFDLGMPVVISCRGSQINVALHNPERAKLVDDLKSTFSKAVFTHCVSKDILQNAIEFGLDPQKAVIINPAVDTDFFKPVENFKKESDRLQITTIGRLSWVKGYEYALIALSNLKALNISFQYNIIGKGTEHQRILFTADDLKIENDVCLHGDLQPGVVLEQLHKTDIFLLPSVSEGFSNAVLEAQSLGIPIVCTDTGGLPENIVDNITGILVPAREPEAIAQALKRLCQDPVLRQQMGEKGRERVLADFSLDQQIPKFVDLFQKAHQTMGNHFENFHGR